MLDLRVLAMTILVRRRAIGRATSLPITRLPRHVSGSAVRQVLETRVNRGYAEARPDPAPIPLSTHFVYTADERYWPTPTRCTRSRNRGSSRKLTSGG